MTKMNFNTVLISLMLIMCSMLSASAQIDTIDVAKQDLITANLKEGLNQYLVYTENPKKKKITGHSLWNRQVNFKKINGKDVIEIEQYWSNNDTTFNRYVYSINDKNTFAPIYHYTKSSRGVEAFDFTSSSVTGSDSVTNNAKKNLEVTLSKPTLNWEVDLEVYSTLPFKKVGQRFIINFYHPGGRFEPAYYEYAVIGEDNIASVGDNHKTSCWKLKINYTPDDWAFFWISKKSKEVLKMQEYYKGNYRYKVKLVTPVPATQL
jgi:hypothetical protein